jgi:hypothetical protein
MSGPEAEIRGVLDDVMALNMFRCFCAGCVRCGREALIRPKFGGCFSSRFYMFHCPFIVATVTVLKINTRHRTTNMLL